MSDPMLDLASALDRDASAFVVVYYPERITRESLLADVESLLPASVPHLRTASIDEALAHPEALVSLLPDDESAAVLTLDGMREHFLQPPRQQPVVLFLLRGGQGEKTLPHAPAFASWIRGQEVDPEKLAQIDVEQERGDFLARTGRTPQVWLASWRAGEMAATAETLALSYRAQLLEGA